MRKKDLEELEARYGKLNRRCDGCGIRLEVTEVDLVNECAVCTCPECGRDYQFGHSVHTRSSRLN